MNFKPGILKIIISIGVIIFWYVLMLDSTNSRALYFYPCPNGFKGSDCEKVFILNIIPEQNSSGCSCLESTSFSDILMQLVTLLFPGVFVYIIWSLIENKSK